MIKPIKESISKKKEVKENNNHYNEFGWYIDDDKNRHFKDSESFKMFVEMVYDGKINVE